MKELIEWLEKEKEAARRNAKSSPIWCGRFDMAGDVLVKIRQLIEEEEK